ncbi:ABC transporter ATP-binding protein [Paenibacillus arenilitoris]|uniref:ABC transporter ATP-binding protein n=1 Tax=Paenibacillus arenilitoris TaxID=2772299 RepID=A0A927H8T4_9BACL|nr:ABC transporter ATP-binding protein [Paenibacillus arenilitoris]MBD2872028.1 ABC transporter ATP-binding protein [Paenibacillus arenilitoris]
MASIFHYMKRLRAVSGTALYVNLFGMVVSSFLDSVSILLLIPLLSLIGIVSMDMGAGYFSWISDVLDNIPPTTALLIILGAYIAIMFGQSLVQRHVAVQSVALQQKFGKALRLETYQALLAASWPFFLKKRSSDLINLLTIELARVLGAVSLFLQLTASIVFTLIQIGLAFWLSPGLTLFVLASGIVLGLFSRRFIKRAKRLGSQTSKLSQSYLAGITDQLNGIKDVKSNTLERSRLRWLDGLTDGMAAEQLAYIRLRSSSQLIYKMSSAVLIAVFLFISYKLFHTQSLQLLTITAIFARLWPRFTSIQSNLEQLASMAPACKGLLRLQEDCRQAAERLEAPGGDAVSPMRVEQGIDCVNVSFRYNKNDSALTLQNIHLHIPANRMTAIAGPSGAGKSTLIDLVMGMIRPEDGQLRIDGQPVGEENLLAYRKSISYVAQDPFLFNASIRENLLLIKPDATEEEMWEALEFAASSDFVRKLPQGLDTVIGDRGIRLSGGERQRIVLARAVIRKPAILVLDEATSALDTENEKKIQEAIDRLKGKMTIIVVAHRLSTIRHADQVIVIDQGKLVERGDYRQLAADPTSLLGHLIHSQAEEIA